MNLHLYKFEIKHTNNHKYTVRSVNFKALVWEIDLNLKNFSIMKIK